MAQNPEICTFFDPGNLLEQGYPTELATHYFKGVHMKELLATLFITIILRGRTLALACTGLWVPFSASNNQNK